MARTLASGDRSEIDPDLVCAWYFSSGTDEVLHLSFDDAAYIFSEVVPLETNDFTRLWEDHKLYMST